MMNPDNSPRKNFIITPTDLSKKVALSDMAAAANSELIQQFIANPNQPISIKDFLEIQKKYQLSAEDAYHLLMHQI
jgi:hypothetical protein